MLKKSSSWQKSGQKNSYRKLISSFLVSTRSKSLLGNFLWWRISARSQGGAGFCCAKTSAPPFDLASILHHKKFPAAFRPCTNQETQKYLLIGAFFFLRRPLQRGHPHYRVVSVGPKLRRVVLSYLRFRWTA